MAMTIKFSTYGLIMQLFCMSLLYAYNGNAQYRSTSEIIIKKSVNGLKIKEIFDVIESSSELDILFLEKDIDNKKTISIHPNKSRSVYDILMEVSKQAGLKFRQVNHGISVSPLQKSDLKNNVSRIKMLREVEVSGKVTDENGEGLPGASVVEKGTAIGTTTGLDGNFKLSVQENSVLVVSFVGYKTVELNLAGRSVIDIQMELDAEQLEEVVVIGYGTVKKSDVTGSVISIDEERIDRLSSAGNILGTIQGAIPGLNVITTQSSAEQNSTIEVRGVKSITASNEPLIVLDGVPFFGNLSELPITDISSIEVLKDASSAAVYGSRGANGVIIITTKKGETGKTNVQVNSKFGIIDLSQKPKLFTGPEFYAKKYEYYNRTQGLSDPTDIFTQSELDNYNNGTHTDWIDIVTRVGKQQEHTISLSGRDHKQSFYVSANLLKTEGIAINDDFSRHSFRFNYDNTLSSWLKFATNTSMIYLDRDGIPANFQDAYYMNPLTIPYNEDGTIKRFPWPERLEFASPLDGLVADNTQKEYKLFSNNYLDADIPFVSGLNYKLNTGVTFRFRNDETYYDRETKRGFENGGYSDVNNDYSTRYLVEHILSYRREIGVHSIYLTGLYSFQKDQFKRRGGVAIGFTSDIMTTWQESGAALSIPSSDFNSSSLISQMFRANYSFNQRYSLAATIRRDGFSGFGADTKYGIFPSMGIAWNIGEEDFLKGEDWVDNLKIRASYGKNGNQGIGAYSTLSRLREYNYLGGPTGTETAPGYLPSALANPNLGWETTQTIDWGVDFGLFNGKLVGSFSMYKSKVTDLLLNRKISTTLGIPGSSIRQNIGETENTGYELDLSSDIVSSDAFSYSLNFNISSFKNKIVDLYGNGQDDVLNQWFIGKPINVIYGYVHNGIWQEGDEAEIAESPLPDKIPGATKVLDANGDGKIDPDDRRVQGSVYPDFRTGLNSFFRYKDFSLNLMFYAVVGVEKVNEAGLVDHTWEYRRNNGAYWDYWTEDNPSNYYYGNFLANNAGYPVLFLQDASYLRLRDVKLSYDFTSLLSRLTGVQQCSVFLNINNVFTITSWEGMDPELTGASEAFGSSQWDVVPVPPQRTFLMGLNLKF